MPDEELAAALSGVEGWFHEDEARALHDAVVRRGGHPRIVEIGSWKGRSTITLGLAVHRLGGGQVIAIDPHTGNVEHHERYGAVDTYAEFLANVEAAGVADVVRPVRRPAHEARAEVDGPVDVLFVDGSHEYPDVVQDLDDWTPLLVDGGLLVLNDTSWPGVHRAVVERVARRRSPWRRARLVRSTLFVDHRPGAPWTRGDDAHLALLRALLLGRRAASPFVRRMPGWLKAAGNRVTRRLSGASR